MSLHDILILSKKVIFSWPVLLAIVAVFLFLSLIFYIANYHKDVFDYSIPIIKKTKKDKEKSKK